jgi:hypothetical protein
MQTESKTRVTMLKEQLDLARNELSNIFYANEAGQDNAFSKFKPQPLLNNESAFSLDCQLGQ